MLLDVGGRAHWTRFVRLCVRSVFCPPTFSLARLLPSTASAALLLAVSRDGAPANLREALVGPFERVQVGGVVQVERCIGELHNPPPRRRAP